MMLFQGPSVFTASQIERKLLYLRREVPGIQSLTASFIFYIDLSAELSTSDRQRLLTILDATGDASLPLWNGHQFWVMARQGTSTSWRDKATDIVHQCGLSQVLSVRRIFAYDMICDKTVSDAQMDWIHQQCYDPLTQSLVTTNQDWSSYFDQQQACSVRHFDVLTQGMTALDQAQKELGFQLSEDERVYLCDTFVSLDRNPSDVELMMFAQVNSEHCRHKIFNAQWRIDGAACPMSLFDMIRHTYRQHPEQALVAYHDNAAVLKTNIEKKSFYSDPVTHRYDYTQHASGIVFKVETHNHPTAISPFAGAATGSGGEIRDEAATGRGAIPKAGLVGFATSHLQIPGYSQPWELDVERPSHLASALQIMLEAPIGSASFNNEFGRPCINGFFRTFELSLPSDIGDVVRGYYKPIMLAGGVGSIDVSLLHKIKFPLSSKLIVLGGPAMLIGLGGGSASSSGNQADQMDLDFASVQRANPEMQRRAQEVINCCWQSGASNPILSIHDVGAGGLSNALPELVYMSERGAQFNLSSIPQAQEGMSPLEVWCNEAQERYVLAIAEDQWEQFDQWCLRERCPYAVIGEVTNASQLVLNDDKQTMAPIDMPLSVLLKDMPMLSIECERSSFESDVFDMSALDLRESIERVLQFPCVASKEFLITIGDRSVGGLVVRDPMVGPWQVPVADVAVTCQDFCGDSGEAMAMGERSPIAWVHPAASARMAVGEAITNMAAASIDQLSDVAFSANWMAASDYGHDLVGLYDAVQAISMELCPALGISIPVGKDSLSMQVQWKDSRGNDHLVASPVSLVISAVAPVFDVKKTLTPLLNQEDDTVILFIDLGEGSHCMGGSVLAQCYQTIGQRPADIHHPHHLKAFFVAIQELKAKDLILAYHDRSDGGLLITLLEMAFASHVGLDIDISSLGANKMAALFTEELGAAIQVRRREKVRVEAILKNHGLLSMTHSVATVNADDQVRIRHDDNHCFAESRSYLQCLWSQTSYQMTSLRDNPDCASEWFEQLTDDSHEGLRPLLTFDRNEVVSAPFVHLAKPKVAILREQGINGYVEMAAAFDRAGFDCIDVHMTDLLHDRIHLGDVKGVVACGGFSYGDVLGAGRGWALSVLQNEKLHSIFYEFFHRKDTFTLGVCNGCQMLSALSSLIPGAAHWPVFDRNRSEQFESRWSQIRVNKSPALFFDGMEGSVLPVVIAHGEGRANFLSNHDHQQALSKQLVSMQYVNSQHDVAISYPDNPNGSVDGVTGLTSCDGRVLMMMPHPERCFRLQQWSWHPSEWQDRSPWMRFFENARRWVG